MGKCDLLYFAVRRRLSNPLGFVMDKSVVQGVDVKTAVNCVDMLLYHDYEFEEVMVWASVTFL